ncbi:MAG TPA: pyrroline-5-carboxylate reductase [Aggregatilineales bacterium]|nr:pyrroline-5-carboxylate reductase [Chloroflexota bacterium]HOA24395.1 pyrroline-5-carboxylate reductase [Aggregatilineales bacterium]HPV05623.1 pyrroline-5-carboxylate reductase [Aggregatilineales bacterium]HQA67594.1 pyrroline-5-carboxylate reductase [Aggregatilineales bacterium]HQE18980.1 pyrroline-5-carboxylate reductase [Aggregatilineales bacterium]
MLTNKKIAFIGSGMMAEAMIKALLREKLVQPQDVLAAGPRAERGRELEKRYGVNWTTDNREAVKDRDVVILSVKPQAMGQVLSELCGLIAPDALVLSIAAGVPINLIAERLAHPAVVRAMPNTPAQIGAGITVWTATDRVTDEQMKQTDTILRALGEVVHVEEESYLDMATALSGTGPAYVLLFMEAMIDAGVHLGFSRRVAEQLVLQTMQGTVEYARQSPRHPATLRNEVTSPGGTTAEALYQLEKGGLRTVISRAIWAAYQRSLALGAGNTARLKRVDDPPNGEERG